MRNWILNSFIKPYTHSYQFFVLLDRYFYAILLIVSLVIITYPLSRYGYLYYSIQQQETIIEQLDYNLDKQQKLLLGLRSHLNKNNQEQTQFSEVNQKIQAILQQYQVSVEHWQWNLEQEAQLYLIIKHNSKTLFNILNEINNIPALQTKEISLTKLYQQRLVELNAIFILP